MLRTATILALALLSGCSLTPRQKAIGAAVIITSIALSAQHSDNNKFVAPLYNCGECRPVK